MQTNRLRSPVTCLGTSQPRHCMYNRNVLSFKPRLLHQPHQFSTPIFTNRRLAANTPPLPQKLSATAAAAAADQQQPPPVESEADDLQLPPSANPYRLAWDILKPDVPLLALTALIVICTTAASLTFPLAIGGLFDAVKDNPQLATTGLGMIESIKSVAPSAPAAFKQGLLTLYVCLIFSAAGNGAVSFISQTIAQRFASRTRQRLFGDTLTRDQTFFDRTPRGELLSRLTQDVTLLQTIIADVIGQRGFRSLLEVTCSVIVIAQKNPVLAIFSFAVAPTLSRLVRIVVTHAAQLTIARQQAQAAALQLANQRLTDVRTVQIFAQEQQEASAFNILIERGYTLAQKVAVFQGIVECAGRTALNIGTVAVLGFGGWLVLQGKLSVGSLLAFNIYNIFISIGLSSVAGSLGDVGKGAGALQRIASLCVEQEKEQQKQRDTDNATTTTTTSPTIISSPTATAAVAGTITHDPYSQIQQAIASTSNTTTTPTTATTTTATTASPPGSQIEFKDVWFKYPGSQDWQLRGFNLTIPSNQSVALCGPSGSGKTTAVSLLLGIYGPPQRGSILVDGIPVLPDTLKILRPRMAAVLQQPMLMSGTVAEVIASGAAPSASTTTSTTTTSPSILSPPSSTATTISTIPPGVSQTDIETAAKIADAHTFITTELPQAYNSQVGERGNALSGGQRQRLALSRALLRKPQLLVLDEATSALDPLSERAVCEAFKSLEDCTRVMIAHRLSTAQAAEKIVVVKDGCVVEQGTQEELITVVGGVYRRMVSAGDANDLYYSSSGSDSESEAVGGGTSKKDNSNNAAHIV